MKKHRLLVAAVACCCFMGGAMAGQYSYEEEPHNYNNFACDVDHPGIQIAAAKKSVVDGQTVYTMTSIPLGWEVGGVVKKDRNTETLPVPTAPAKNNWRDQNNWTGEEVIYYPANGISSRMIFTLDQRIQRIGGISFQLHPGNIGPEGTSCDRGFVRDPLGTKYYNERGAIKVPVCKPIGSSVDDWVNLTDVKTTEVILKRMGREMPNEPFMALHPTANRLATDTDRAGKTDSYGTSILGLTNANTEFRIATKNHGALFAPTLTPGKRPTSDEIANSAMSLAIPNDGGSYEVVIPEANRPIYNNIGLAPFNNDFVYLEATWENLRSTPDHMMYILWSYDQNGEYITYYTATDEFGAAYVPNGGTAFLMLTAYDSTGTMYAYNPYIFTAPYWPVTASASASISVEASSESLRSMAKKMGANSMSIVAQTDVRIPRIVLDRMLDVAKKFDLNSLPQIEQKDCVSCE